MDYHGELEMIKVIKYCALQVIRKCKKIYNKVDILWWDEKITIYYSLTKYGKARFLKI